MERDQATKFINDLLRLMISRNGSDLFITADFPPAIKVDGKVTKVSPQPLSAAHTMALARSVMNDKQVAEFERTKECNFAISPQGIGRFRANAFKQRSSYALALRVVPNRVRSLSELGAPQSAIDLLNKPYGLVLVVGPTGSGKSTTLAAMIDRINETKPCHILTIEDPVEYLHQHKTAMINQREVGTDVNSFTDGLRSALREDPDVILLGEMRDLDSISITLTLAETGHLVFATLHTNDASQALDRIVDVFPAEKRDQIQIQLAGSLQGVLSQRLLPAEGGGRVAAYEVLVANEAVRNLLREGKTRQLRNVMISGQQEGMQTIEMDLARLVASGIISFDTAAEVSAYPKEIMTLAATQKSQMQAQATIASGQAASGGAGELIGSR